MVRHMLLATAAVTLGVYGVVAVVNDGPSNGNGNGTGTGTGPLALTASNGTANNGNNGNGGDPPKDGCKPANVPPKGEDPARDDPRCPGYNGNAENTFTLSSTNIDKPQTITVSGGWCGGGGTVTFKMGTWTVGTLPVAANRKFNGPLTFDNEPVGSNQTLSAICTTGTRTATINVVP
jgi:hypothetical protein